jgi:hypothetical protein|tara:strand:+ start:135 stop:2669 length:2535 start_codon:yes stop_codon:yes gene_type:complete
MAIEKSLYSESDPDVLAALEIEIENPDSVTISDGDNVISMEFDESEMIAEHGDNLVDFMDRQELERLGSDLVNGFNADRASRHDWEESYIKGLDLMGMKFENRTTPWNGACGVFHPMLSEAVVRFQSQTIMEIFPASGPAKTSIVGEVTDEKAKQAERVQDYLNYMMTVKMPEYRTETEKLLFSLPIAGSAFRKVYFDPNLGRACSMFVPAEDFVVSYGASDLETAERCTHVMKKTTNEVLKLQQSGFYADIELPAPAPDTTEITAKYNKLTGDHPNYEVDQRHTLLECMVDIDLAGFEDTDNGEPTNIGLPYVITVDKSSSTILSIRRNWKEDDELKLKRQHFVHYQYLPGLGFYGFGLVHMIGGLTKSATSLLRQLVDAGTLANLPGGLKARGLRIKGDSSPIMPGEFRDVDVPGGVIRDNITFLPYKEPSAVLHQMLQEIVEDGRRFASAGDLKASDINGEAPVGTTLALLEREMKVISAVQARVHAAMRRELGILSDIVADYGPTEYPYGSAENAITAEDFDDRIDIIPVSDPNSGTMSQRIMQYQAALQLAQQAPQMYDLPLLHRQMLEVLGIRDADKIIPTTDDIKPTDPISENMNLMVGKPVTAFIYQDHKAHIEAHTSAMNDPKIAELLNLAPDAQVKQAALAAHVAEHVAFQYRQDIEKELGVALPAVDSTLPEDIEYRLSQLVAPAAAQLTGRAQQEMQAQEMMQQAEDPVLQLQKAELELENIKIETKASTDMARIQADLTKAAARDDLERDKLSADQQMEGAKLGVQISEANAQSELESKKISSKDQLAGAKMGMEIAKEMMVDNRERDIEEMINKRDTTRERDIDKRELDE